MCRQETMLDSYEAWEWNIVEQGFLVGFLAVIANGGSRGVVFAWNEIVFSKVDSKMRQFSAAVKLKRQSDDL